MAGLTVKIKGDASQFDKTMSGVKGTINSIKSPLGAITKAGAAIGAAFTAAAGAVAYAGYRLNSIGEEGRASDAKLKNVVQTMGLFGNQADVVANRLLDVADATARKIGVDDDLIASTQAIVMSFEDIGKTADQTGGLFDQVTKAALDMSVLFGGDATSYAVQLGKALSDPEKGLTALKKTGALLRADIERIGGEFVRTGDKGKAFAEIIGAINRQVSGQSEAVAKTSEKIKVSLGQVIESFAKPFSEGFNGLPAALEAQFPAMSAKATELGKVVGGSISQAIAGDSTNLIATGMLIGNLIGGGIQIAFDKVFNELGKGISTRLNALLSTMPIMRLLGKDPLGAITGTSQQAINAGPQASTRHSLNMMKNQFEQDVQNLRASTITMTAAGGDQFRPARPGETSIFSDAFGNKVVPLLEKIVTNTQQTPFPAR
jgi:hypothetical protein